MKKQIVIITLLSLALSGCSNASTTPIQTGNQPKEAATAASGTETAAAPTAAGQDTMQKVPQQGKRVRGQIQDILGNEVTLALMEEPKRPEGADAAAQKPKTTSGDPMGGPPGMGGSSREVKLTGETLGLQIPVGVPIVSGGRNGETALQLSDLSTGDVIAVMYDTDGATIIKVNVSTGSAQ